MHGTVLPKFDDFSPGNRAHDPRQLLLWAIDEVDGNRSYRPLYGGAYVAEAHGPNAREELSEPLRVIFKAGMDACTTTASITYMSFETSDAAGHRVTCERMLLPFGRGGRKSRMSSPRCNSSASTALSSAAPSCSISRSRSK